MNELKRSSRKEIFAPIPLRAVSDMRLSARHLRVLAAIAYHDRFGRNGQGCWAGRKRLAVETGISGTHVSDMLSDLRIFGYITSDRHPMNLRTIVHRVLYDESKRSQIGDPLQTSDRSHSRDEQVPSQNANVLEKNGKGVSNILGINLIRDPAEAASESSRFEKRDRAEARTSEIGKVEIEDAESYLSAVNEFASDKATLPALKCEYPKLAELAADERMPQALRQWAASLREVASNAA